MSGDAPASTPSSAPAGGSSTATMSIAKLPDIDVRTLLRMVSWCALGVFLFVARPFFPVMLGTFIVSYVANSTTTWLVARTRGRVPRRVFVVCFFVIIVLLVTAFSLMTVPSIVREAQYFIRTLQSDNPYVVLANTMRKVLGEELADKVEQFVSFSSEQPLTAAATTVAAPADSVERSRRLGVLLHDKLRGYIAGTVALTTRLVGAMTKVVFKALLSLIFAFMVIWDLPRVTRGVQSLRYSRLGFMYDDLAQPICQFGNVVGKAFEAQGAIALANTALTTSGLIVLGVPGVGFLSVVTLLCSFIPVAGVFISTTPMVILALSEYGVAKACWVVVMVILVHLVEAYVLNPQIYSLSLHLHPLFVISVLYVAEHSFGIAGLLMAVPVAVYLLRSVVKVPENVEESVEGKKMLDKASGVHNAIEADGARAA